MERMMATINEEWWEAINNSLADGTPCLLGTVSGDGQPQISPKGSILVCFFREHHFGMLSRLCSLVGGNTPSSVSSHQNKLELPL